MIRFKKEDLGFTMASRAFRTEAGKCGNNTQRQLASVQREYERLRGRHPGEDKFLRGIDRAFDAFVATCNGKPPYTPDLPLPEHRGALSQPGSYVTAHANPTYVPVPSEDGYIHAGSHQGDAPSAVEISYWRAQYDNEAAEPDGDSVEAYGIQPYSQR